MIKLLETYTFSEIIIFIIILALAVKGIIEFYDWAKSRLDSNYTAKTNKDQRLKRIEKEEQEDKNKINQIFEQQEKFKKTIEELKETILSLQESDKSDIRAWIVREHHFFCYQKHWIDDFSLQVIEERFKHYKDIGGNGYVDTLMNEMRALPKVKMDEIE